MPRKKKIKEVKLAEEIFLINSEDKIVIDNFIEIFVKENYKYDIENQILKHKYMYYYIYNLCINKFEEKNDKYINIYQERLKKYFKRDTTEISNVFKNLISLKIIKLNR